MKLQNATLSKENRRNSSGYKRKQTQGVAYVNKLTCCGFRMIIVERSHFHPKDYIECDVVLLLLGHSQIAVHFVSQSHIFNI